MQFAFFALFAAAIVAADQFTKYLTVANIALGEQVAFIPGLIRFTFVRNFGAAFSSFQNQQWLFALIFAAVTVAVLYEYFKKPMPFKPWERWCIFAIYGGGLGLFFGWLYRRFGIQYAMIGHALAHIVSKLIWFIFL